MGAFQMVYDVTTLRNERVMRDYMHCDTAEKRRGFTQVTALQPMSEEYWIDKVCAELSKERKPFITWKLEKSGIMKLAVWAKKPDKWRSTNAENAGRKHGTQLITAAEDAEITWHRMMRGKGIPPSNRTRAVIH
jgi:hypothetical protein